VARDVLTRLRGQRLELVEARRQALVERKLELAEDGGVDPTLPVQGAAQKPPIRDRLEGRGDSSA